MFGMSVRMNIDDMLILVWADFFLILSMTSCRFFTVSMFSAISFVPTWHIMASGFLLIPGLRSSRMSSLFNPETFKTLILCVFDIPRLFILLSILSPTISIDRGTVPGMALSIVSFALLALAFLRILRTVTFLVSNFFESKPSLLELCVVIKLLSSSFNRSDIPGISVIMSGLIFQVY